MEQRFGFVRSEHGRSCTCSRLPHYQIWRADTAKDIVPWHGNLDIQRSFHEWDHTLWFVIAESECSNIIRAYHCVNSMQRRLSKCTIYTDTVNLAGSLRPLRWLFVFRWNCVDSGAYG